MSTKLNKVLDMLRVAEEAEQELIIERDEWQGRAEVAESVLAVSQAEARGMTALYDACVKINKTLSKRVAELEARLAEREWRPVTDDAPEAGNLVELLVRGHRSECGRWWWWYPDGDSPINGWRPLPPPPAAIVPTSPASVPDGE